MGFRDRAVAKQIYKAIFNDKTGRAGFVRRALVLFSLFNLALARYDDDLFKELRKEIWKLDEAEYREAFERKDRKVLLKPVGDLGYSGSTFFTTNDSKFLIKSIPRSSESRFFKDELLRPYFEHMSRYPSSLLVRITDCLYAPYTTIGSLLGLAPSHHIIMENVLYGQETHDGKDKWENFDLKPSTYFYPERDIAGGKLMPKSVKDRLLDEFTDKIRVTSHERDEMVETLVKDTKILEASNAIDYSLFLVRFPHCDGQLDSVTTPTDGIWRRGVTSNDGKWVYKAILLDFFWATHTLQAKTMTGLIKSYNVLDKKGPMSITTNPAEYRTRFLRMVEDLFEVDGKVQSSIGNERDPFADPPANGEHS